MEKSWLRVEQAAASHPPTPHDPIGEFRN